MKIVVLDYCPSWATQFKSLSDELRPIVDGLASSIEHVGSTSVVGLAAKPIIDIDIVVTRENVPQVISALEAYGYKHRGNLGIEDREVFANPPHTTIPHHLYVCVEGSLALKNHLELRDCLRTRPQKVVEYGNLKKDIARCSPVEVSLQIGLALLGRPIK